MALSIPAGISSPDLSFSITCIASPSCVSSVLIRPVSSVISAGFSIDGRISFINVTSALTLFCVDVFMSLESSDNTLICLISVSTSASLASSIISAILSFDTSITSSILSVSLVVFISKRFLRYHIKSVTNCDKSRPCMIMSSIRFMQRATSFSLIVLYILLNIAMSTAPSTSSTSSYLSSSPK